MKSQVESSEATFRDVDVVINWTSSAMCISRVIMNLRHLQLSKEIGSAFAEHWTYCHPGSDLGIRIVALAMSAT